MRCCIIKSLVEDRGAWWAAVHGITRVGHDLATEQQQQQQLVFVRGSWEVTSRALSPEWHEQLHYSVSAADGAWVYAKRSFGMGADRTRKSTTWLGAGALSHVSSLIASGGWGLQTEFHHVDGNLVNHTSIIKPQQKLWTLTLRYAFLFKCNTIYLT